MPNQTNNNNTPVYDQKLKKMNQDLNILENMFKDLDEDNENVDIKYFKLLIKQNKQQI